MWVRSRVHSKASLLTLARSDRNCGLIAGHQGKGLGKLVLKRLELPEGFQGKVFKDKVRGGESLGV